MPPFRIINARDNFDTAFASIPAGIKALVVSACPHFLGNLDRFVTAANGWLMPGGRFIMYPFQEYRSASVTPGSGSLFYGPKLTKRSGPLEKLGQKAKAGVATDFDDAGDDENNTG